MRACACEREMCVTMLVHMVPEVGEHIDPLVEQIGRACIEMGTKIVLTEIA